MSQLLSLSKAARLAGVSRAEIQERIKEQGAETFEGKLTAELLQKLYPHIDLEADPVLDRIEKIKSDARPKSRYGDGWIPDPEMLMSRLKQFHRILVANDSTFSVSEALVEAVLEQLNRTIDAPEAQLRAEVADSVVKLERLLQRLQRAGNTNTTQSASNTSPKPFTSKVRILPSGHEFVLEGNDSILAAGLKAGFYLDYGCNSHNCGKCICRVINGEVLKIEDHDYLLTAREKEQGFILACCHTAGSDLILEAAEAGAAEELPRQEIRAVVRRISLQGDNLALLEIQTPRSRLLRFKAGQRVVLVTEDNSVVELYIASCPCDGRNLQFLVYRQPGDAFSEQVFNGALGKQTVLLQGPFGNFLLQGESTTAAVFVASGQGFAPIKSLLEQTINIDDSGNLHLVQADCYPSHSSLDKLCRAWADALENFIYTVVRDPRDTDGLAELLSCSVAGAPDAQVYIAGPSDWLSKLKAMVQSKDLDPTGWHCEAVD